MPRWAWWSVVLTSCFVASRVYVLRMTDVKGSTLGVVDVPYAEAYERSLREQTPFYATLQAAKRAADLRASQPTSASEPLEYGAEYPPLALAWMIAPTLIVDAYQPAADDAHHLQSAIRADRAWEAAVDLVGFAVLLWVLPQLVPVHKASRRAVCLLTYTVAGLVLADLLYDRFDLAVGVSILVGIVLLLRRHHVASLAVLAFAINLKLVPLVLLPVWVIGVLPVSMFAAVRLEGGATRLIKRAVATVTALACFVGALFVPFYVGWGRGALAWVPYHLARGIEIGSVWSPFIIVAERLRGHRVPVILNFGAFHLAWPHQAAIGRLAFVVTTLTLAAVYVSFYRTVCRRVAFWPRSDRTVAQAAPSLLIGYSALCLLVFMATSKVLSPQYLLWVVPLMPLVGTDRPAAGWGRLVAAFLAVCVLTHLIYPVYFDTEIVRDLPIPDPSGRLTPSRFGMGLLLARNLMLATMVAALWMSLKPTQVGSPTRTGRERRS